LIYIGKATSLKNRVKSYFVGKRTSRPIEQMIHEVKNIKIIQTDSVLEAVILEAVYIKKYLPKYNVDGKDNKSWNYIVITKDSYPRIETYRHHQMQVLTEAEQKKRFAYRFGPYPGLNTKATLKLLRRLFGYSTCKPKATRPCIYYQMQQCLGVCTGEISSSEYKRVVIMPLVAFLKGRKKRVIATLVRRMKKMSVEKDFEEAARLRDQIRRLQRIHDIALLNKSFFNQHSSLKSSASGFSRIEGYDISNLGATGKVGSMVVFDHGEAKKSAYRKFKIKTVVGQSDVACLEEVLLRRLNHDEWPLPELFLIDGGKPQINRVVKILKEKNIVIPVVGIAKGADRKKNEFLFGEMNVEKQYMRAVVKWVSEHQNILIKVRDEAHRFAIAYQRKLRGF
jgi:excinuclease ABC subunit C